MGFKTGAVIIFVGCIVLGVVLITKGFIYPDDSQAPHQRTNVSELQHAEKTNHETPKEQECVSNSGKGEIQASQDSSEAILNQPPDEEKRTASSNTSIQEHRKTISENACKELIDTWEETDRNGQQMILQTLAESRKTALIAFREVLSTGSNKQKVLACRFLSDAADPDSESALIQTVEDEHPEVQVNAITALRSTGGPEGADAIRRKLATNPSGGILKASLITLGKLGDEQDIPILRSYLKHADEAVRANAAAALALLGSEEGQEVLLTASQSDNPLACIDGIAGLGFLNTPESYTQLLALSQDPSGRWSSEAQVALASRDIKVLKSEEHKADRLAELSSHSNVHLSVWAMEQLSDIGSDQARATLTDKAHLDDRTGLYARYLLNIKEENLP